MHLYYTHSAYVHRHYPPDEFSGSDVPKAVGVIFGTAEYVLAWFVHIKRGDFPNGLCQALYANTTEEIPEANRAILGASNNQVTNSVKDRMGDDTRMPGEGLDNCIPFQINKTGGLVIATCHEMSAVIVELDAVDITF